MRFLPITSAMFIAISQRWKNSNLSNRYAEDILGMKTIQSKKTERPVRDAGFRKAVNTHMTIHAHLRVLGAMSISGTP